MKKIDLHIHTVPTINDKDFVFSLDNLSNYVTKLNIDCIAITNHNIFDQNQYNEITDSLDIDVFPGIEIDLEKSHVILLTDFSDIIDFVTKCSMVSSKIITKKDYLTIDEFKSIFSDLEKYIIIPHYEKSPVVSSEVLTELSDYISVGEVSSPKKFISCYKDEKKLIPVLFSDLRITNDMKNYSTRQTYVDLEEFTISSLKGCLNDRTNVALTEENGNDFFQVLENGLKLSSGLNVILGERSSGKTYTLDQIYNLFDSVKYIQQFSLLEKDEKKDKEKFEEKISRSKSSTTEEFLKEFKTVIDDVSNINLNQNFSDIDGYINSLLKSASEYELEDIYSKTGLFNESLFTESNNDSLKELIKAISTIIDNSEYRETIQKYLKDEDLKKLSIELIGKYIELDEANKKKIWLNDLITNIQKTLQYKTSATKIIDIDFFRILKEREKINRFEKVVKGIKQEKEIKREDIQGFHIVANTRKYSGASDLQKTCGRRLIFSNAYPKYDTPYEYLAELKKVENLESTEYYKYFINTEYSILNKHGFKVSGGERSEFNLLEAIKDALQYDLLLIDEPESSFDNLFLNNHVNNLIKHISTIIPVIVVTHNNTVGASIKPNYLGFTKKEIVDGKVVYKIFTGYPNDKNLKSPEGETLSNYDILLNCLEAGNDAYKYRGETYEHIKN